MFDKILKKQFPRMLTQACRDKYSPFYGCFDRNWWHYRIRDYSSDMLQQGGYFAFLYSKLEDYKNYKQQLKKLARASALFWNQKALKHGAFEEYYPRERGYPPLVFSTLAMAKLVSEGIVYSDEILGGLKKASRQLQGRFESQAGNQQVAGLAALAVIRKISPELVNEDNFKAIKKRTLQLQREEGWFAEYGGPDLGYLSVTLDCLWDLYDHTSDNDFLRSAEKALDFIHGFVLRRGNGAGMQNARNTDYIVPYGITRFLEHSDMKTREKSKDIMGILFPDTDDMEHFFHGIDDRYWIHYIGHSVARATLTMLGVKTLKSAGKDHPEPDHTFLESGYIFRDLPEAKKRLVVATKKGGILSVFSNEKTLFSDYGWIAVHGKKQFVNHWWSDTWEILQDENSIEIRGALFPHREKKSTPFLHFWLRVFGLVPGGNLTRILRNILIYKSKTSGIRFHRKIDIGSDALIITDTISEIDKKLHLYRAPRASKRHVASADSWHREDFLLNTIAVPAETIIRKDKKAVVTTIYNLL
ncbi:MAG: hypothetical protein K9J30_01025 [Bacteroidales bacterium]|nr:hypothetical protein [Bacteroidales bacterium]